MSDDFIDVLKEISSMYAKFTLTSLNMEMFFVLGSKLYNYAEDLWHLMATCSCFSKTFSQVLL
jgi:hypothetical protein